MQNVKLLPIFLIALLVFWTSIFADMALVTHFPMFTSYEAYRLYRAGVEWFGLGGSALVMLASIIWGLCRSVLRSPRNITPDEAAGRRAHAASLLRAAAEDALVAFNAPTKTPQIMRQQIAVNLQNAIHAAQAFGIVRAESTNYPNLSEGEGWRKWPGVGQPPDEGALLLSRRDGRQFYRSSHHGIEWTHDGGPSDIVAYRYIGQEKAA